MTFHQKHLRADITFSGAVFTSRATKCTLTLNYRTNAPRTINERVIQYRIELGQCHKLGQCQCINCLKTLRSIFYFFLKIFFYRVRKHAPLTIMPRFPLVYVNKTIVRIETFSIIIFSNDYYFYLILNRPGKAIFPFPETF